MIDPPLLERRFLWLTFLLLAVLGATQVASVLGESQTADEAVHLSAGYSYLKTGDFRVNYMHPPLGKYINALPLLLIHPHLPRENPSWVSRDDYQFGKVFLYANTTPADRLLFYGRIPTIIVTLCLGLVIAFWTRQQFDAPTALFALLLFSFDPNIIAHGRYITSDLIVTLAIFGASLVWFRYLVHRTRRTLLQAGVVLGVALLTKASAIILFPIFLVLYVICWWQEKETKSSLKQVAQAFVCCSAVAFVVVYAGYGFETRSALDNEAFARRFQMTSEELRADPHVSNLLRWLIDPATAAGRLSRAVVKDVPIPLASYISGAYWQADKNRQGHDSYLLGEHSKKGWWYYFPIALAVKLPTGVILLLLFSLYLALRKIFALRWQGLAHQLRMAPLKWYLLTIAPALYFCASLTSNIDIGIRHILPIFPFFYICLSACLLGKRPRWNRATLASIALVGGLVIFESVYQYPYYLSFFNKLAGGSARGPRFLIDSNIDWGQDLKHLRAYLIEHGDPEVCFSYFGHVDPAYYGIKSRDLTADAKAGGCNVAISVNSLYSDAGQYDWLKTRTPDARIGYSIYYYHLQMLSPVTEKLP